MGEKEEQSLTIASYPEVILRDKPWLWTLFVTPTLYKGLVPKSYNRYKKKSLYKIL